MRESGEEEKAVDAFNFKYEGPFAEFASITGSPLWGLSTEQVIKNRQERGWKLNFSERVPTPYGLGALVSQFTTPSGRDVIWIPSYGGVKGELTSHPHEMQWRLFWILKEAGVKVLLVGGTHGTNDWRGLTTEDSIRPGDAVLPWSYYRTENTAGSLPGTGIGGVLPNLARQKDVFCTELSDWLATELEKLNFFRKVHHPKDVRVILRSPMGGTFESEGETAIWRHSSQTMSEREGKPYVILHGDSISPILCRHLGIHEAYYCLPVNWAEGHPATDPNNDLPQVLDDLYVTKFPPVMLGFEAQVLETIPLPTTCPCESLLEKRPAVYQEALSQSKT